MTATTDDRPRRQRDAAMLRSTLRATATRRPSSTLLMGRLTQRGFASKVTVCGDESAFEKAVSSPSGSVVYFTASWCGPCRMISPVYEELASGAGDGTTFLKVDVDDQPEVAAAAGVTAMPTFKFFKDGQLLDTIVGADAAKLQSLTKEHLS